MSAAMMFGVMVGKLAGTVTELKGMAPNWKKDIASSSG
jgi:hypothetical protein